MASLYKRKNSPFWWIKYRRANGAIIRESTHFKIGIGIDTQRARQLRDQRAFEESKTNALNPAQHWQAWVHPFFQLRYSHSPKSLVRAGNAWRMLAMYFNEVNVHYPCQLTRDHCIAYMAWRQKPNKKLRKYRACHNTAQLELKILGIVMAEAVLRNYAPYNPCRDLGIKRVARAHNKPELTDELIQLIRDRIEDEPEPKRTFFKNSFEIGYYHGARLSETHLNPMRDVEFFTRNGTRSAKISFMAKGGKTHTVMLHPKLHPLFEQLRADRKTETYTPLKSPAKEWCNFLDKIGVKARAPGACFHSLRVTVATRLARAGVSRKKAMDYLAHASSTVHDSYVRLQPEDLQECSAAIQ